MIRPLWKACGEVCRAGLSQKNTVRVAVLLAACLTPILAFAQTDIWSGGAGNWSTAGMWSTGIPTATSNVFIDHGNAKVSPVTVGDGEQCADLTIDSDDSVTLVSNGILNVFGPTISNAGTLSIAATSSQASLDINGFCNPDGRRRSEHVE